MFKKPFLAFIFAILVGITPVFAKGSSSRSSSSRSSFSSKSYSSSPAKSSPSKSYSSSPSVKKYSSSPSSSLSQKPANSGSERAVANNNLSKQKSYLESKKATLPPKESFTTTNGKSVKIPKDSKVVENIRSKPVTSYTPVVREARTVNHVTNYNYQHDPGWYHTQPAFYVGAGYSSAFWWMMSEWSADRRAAWLYNNQDKIEKEAYAEGLKDAKVAAEIEKLKASQAKIDPNYVDAEFKNDPDLMYTQDFVEAAYNPELKPEPQTSYSKYVILGIVFVLIVCVSFYIFLAFGNSSNKKF